MSSVEASGKNKIVVHYDVLSGYSYLAVHVILNSRFFADENIDVELIPVSIQQIFTTVGSQGPMSNKQKAAYTIVDVGRIATRFKLPLAAGMPPFFGKSVDAALRTLQVIKKLYPGEYNAAISAIYQAGWVGHKQLGEVPVLQETLQPVLGNEATEKVLQLQAEDAAAEELKNTTVAAIENGAFGLPWILATNKDGVTDKFWGFDRIGFVMDHLGFERPEKGEEKKSWGLLL